MEVTGAILKQFKNASEHTMKKRRSLAAMAKSSDCTEGIQFEVHANRETHNPSTRVNSKKLRTVNKHMTLPGHYKTL